MNRLNARGRRIIAKLARECAIGAMIALGIAFLFMPLIVVASVAVVMLVTIGIAILATWHEFTYKVRTRR